MKKRILFGLFSVIASMMMLAIPVFASTPTTIPFPDLTALQVSWVNVYTPVLQTGDVLLVAGYNIKYTTAPSTTMDLTYIGRLRSPAGVELGNVVPYAYYNGGYGMGMIALYWPAGTSPTWAAADTVSITGNPLLYWTALTPTTTMIGALAATAVPAYTDETTASNNVTANDMTLLSSTPATNAAYYYMASTPFTSLGINIGTAGVGVWTLSWQYFNGTTWTALADVVDGTSAYMAAAGLHTVTFTLPTDWATTTVSTYTGYFVRSLVTYTSKVTAPLGTQSWTNASGNVGPINTVASLNWYSTGSTSITSTLLGALVTSQANLIGNAWSTALTQSTPNGTKLSAYGEQYFTNVVPYLRQICPQIFTASISAPVIVHPTAYVTPGAVTAAGSWPFPQMDTYVRGFLFLFVAAIIVMLIGGVTGRPDFGLFVVAGSAVVATRYGILPMALGITFIVLAAAALLFVVIAQRGVT